MSDPAKAVAMKWADRRKAQLQACRRSPCYPVQTMLLRGDATVAYPACVVCVHEARLRKLKG